MEELFYESNEPLFSTDLDALKAEKDEERKAQLVRWKSDFINTFCNSPDGRRVLWFLIFETHVFRKITQLNAGSYALIGKQQIGQDIIDIIGPEELLTALIKVRREELERKEGQEDDRVDP